MYRFLIQVNNNPILLWINSISLLGKVWHKALKWLYKVYISAEICYIYIEIHSLILLYILKDPLLFVWQAKLNLKKS